MSWLRLREWRDVFTQLHTLCAEHGWKENDQPAGFEAIHRRCSPALLGHVGSKVEDASGPAAGGSYLGARGIKFWPHPGSAIARKAGKWIMAAELVDTSRLFGRCIAHRAGVAGGSRRPPDQAPGLRAALVEGPGAVRNWERGTLYGPHGLSAARRQLPRHRPALCRELVHPRGGLVQGEIAEGPAGMAFWPTTGVWWPRSNASSTSRAAPTCWWTKN